MFTWCPRDRTASLAPTTISNDPRRRAGFTLIEVILVVLLIALASGGIGLSLGAVFSSQVREGATRLMSASRFAYHRASTHGTTVRIAFNLDKNTFALEESEGTIPVPHVNEREQADKDRWRDAQDRIDQGFRAEEPVAYFFPLEDPNGNELKRFGEQPIGKRVELEGVLTPEGGETSTKKRGMAYLYYLPGGYAQGGVVHISDGGKQRITISFAPLTARSTLFDGFVIPDWLENPDESEVRDPRS